MSIEVRSCSKWYGHILGVSDLDWSIDSGVVGLLGPNGAGKSTLMKMIAGLIRPSRGTVRVFDGDPRSNTQARARIGYCPDHERSYDSLTAVELVSTMARLSGLGSSAETRAKEVLRQMGLSDAMHRRIGEFSKGMRQRTKIAQALVHDPDLLLLDEPLSGVDPVARAEISEQVRQLGAAGKTILVSSHVLHEVESLTSEIVVIYRGQILAEGNVYEIRKLIDRKPHRIRIECNEARAVGAHMAASEHVREVHIERHAATILTTEPDRCYAEIGEYVASHSIDVTSLTSPDNNLAAVFDYLTGGTR